ncbi:hypothetical protein FJ444_13340 [Aestuariibacter sp. GS-14]|uniref:hypothetical protein n=1 Tax=Aestuariibacter sp. GS-14 TaxID=2590670 RepID=UPI00112A7196|nr:hypothetical protein [Aestuariibacter sp. GS-14]TPV57371.1 hypothetical protein FJ444_13340 [Aestuariibacter sp. GS-14]
MNFLKSLYHKPELFSAVIFALSILVMSYLVGDHENAGALITIMLSIYFVVFQRVKTHRKQCG